MQLEANPDKSQNQHKAIVISNPDRDYLLALVDTVGHNQVQALRSTLVNYVTFKTNLTKHQDKFVTSGLAFHVPYYILRLDTIKSPHTSGTALLRTTGTHSGYFAIYEAQVSLIVFGASNTTWMSYCFTRLYDDDGDGIEFRQWLQ
ncbi:hypothetical protein BU25DRAFT_421892 [Macroventuria anomochaeta]|uniref:Uncharacterized protein n=1 Tax=Macroventuria anomochaeta TaxID=301207 RepID=A0ACB6RZM6_9PLEO|nr:uncharacterized protein BU25DRAFT_421892 [Macroventuria anomochaeta]KAF2627485.1 hypothetical protein BU25DRAFT_421892 [Macroventuria anomochaeta]